MSINPRATDRDLTEFIAKRLFTHHVSDHAADTALAIWDLCVDAAKEVLSWFEIHEYVHFCTPGCDDGCDIGRVRTWTQREVIERRQPLTDDDIAEMNAIIERSRAARLHEEQQ